MLKKNLGDRYLGDNIYANFCGRTITVACECPTTGNLSMLVFEPHVCREFIAYSTETLLREQQGEEQTEKPNSERALSKSTAEVLIKDIDSILIHLNRLGSGNAVHLKAMLLYKLAGMRNCLFEALRVDDGAES